MRVYLRHIRIALLRAHGCSTLEELLKTWKEWVPRKREEVLEY